MTELLTSAQMRAIEMAAIESGQVTGLELMERAGHGVVEAVFAQWPELAKAPHRAVVLCGPGNNGGDGFVVARLLTEWGWQAEVFLYGGADKLPPDARVNYERWRALGAVMPFPSARPDPWAADLIVDAGFGTGLSRPLDDDLIASFLSCLPERDLRAPGGPPFVAAIDIPTGLSSDTGALLPAAIEADLTVSFHAMKLGHILGRGPEFCGKTVVAGIGLNGGDRPGGGSGKGPAQRGRDWQSPAVPPREIVTLAGVPAGLGKDAGTHKYGHGHALILSGAAGKTGAARLAARGALRIGAGLVTLGVPGSAQMEVAAQVTAIMLRRVDGAEGLAALLEDARFNALCLGPGLGVERAQDLLPAALHGPRGVVLDADALTAFADDPGRLFGMLHAGCVLTPHGGEFARLFPDLAARLDAAPTQVPAYSKVDATREAAKRAGCVVLFKGAVTVIAAPDGRCTVNAATRERAAPWLATAGAGDVLAGFITGLLARGFDPMQAAEAGAWLHVEAARAFGPGLIAEDLPEALPGVLARLLDG